MRTRRDAYEERLRAAAEARKEGSTEVLQPADDPASTARRAYFKNYRRLNRGTASQRAAKAKRARKYQAKLKKENPELLQLRRRKTTLRQRLAIIAFFGGKCVECGYDDFRGLQLDYINGDGAQVKRNEGKASQNTGAQYTLINSDPDLARLRYRLLCANCNQIKKYENMECRYTSLVDPT